MITYIIYFVTYIFESIIANIYFSENYKSRYKSIITFLIGILIYSLGFAINIIFNNLVFINLLCFFIINIVYAKILYENIKLKMAIFHSAILLAIMFGSEMVIESIMVTITNLNYDSYNNYYWFLIIFGTLSKSTYLIICKLLSYFFSYKKSPNIIIKSLPYIFIYPIMSTILLTLFSYASILYNFSRILNTIFIIISILSLILNCFIFIMYRNMQIKEQEFIKMQTEFQKVELDKTFYDLLEKTNEDQRILIHDIKHHLSAIGAMSSVEDIRNYLGNVQEDFESCQFIGKSKNKMLDLIMNKYYKICQIKGIKYYVDVRSSNLSFIEDNDLISMLGNLFDNAVFAAEKVINPTIEFTLKRERNFVILSIINSSFGMPKTYGDTLITTKPNTLVHGHGVKSVERTATMYDGICHWEYINDSGTFRFNIIFNSTKVLKI